MKEMSIPVVINWDTSQGLTTLSVVCTFSLQSHLLILSETHSVVPKAFNGGKANVLADYC